MMKKPAPRPKCGKMSNSSVDLQADPSSAGTSTLLANPQASYPLPPQNRHLAIPHHSHSLLKFLNEDRTRQKFCDVSVVVGGKVYSAHKVVLAHGSSYFHAELSKSSSATARVTLDHVEDSVFQLLLGFLYTAECVVAEEDLPALTEAARFLNMMDVLKLVCEERGTNSVGVTHAQAEMKGISGKKVTSSDSTGTDTNNQSSPEEQNAFFNQQFHTDTSLQGSLAPCANVAPAEDAKKAEESSVTTRRSSRRRRAPTKYKRDNMKYSITASEEKEKSASPRQVDEKRVEEEEEEGGGEDLTIESQTLLLVGNETFEQTRGSDEMQEDGDDDTQREMNSGSVAQQNIDEANRTLQAVEEPGGVMPAAGSSNRTSGYPEGLDPVIIHTSNKKKLKCPKCDKTFDRAGKYESHTRVHTGEKPFQCDVCLQCYSTKSNLNVHKKKHTSDASFPKKEHKCPFCNKLHASKKTLAKHVRRFHPDCTQEFLNKRKRKSASWECSICSKTFSRKPHLQEHMILHTQDRPFKCSFCDEYFKSRFARLKHQEKYHLGPFPCEICGRQFNDSGNKKRHIECTHGGTRKWTCFICGKSVRERTTLREHLRIHTGEKPHFCSICGQSFRHSSSYRLHLRVHRDDKRYECNECGKTFIRHDHLTKHQKIHSGEKTHQCEECGKCFRRHDHLTVHYKSVHLGEKVWQKYKTAVHQCEVCKKEFKGKSSLEMHFRTHSGEKPHRCPECHQTFRIKKTLTKHMVIHSDARPFNCPHCSATFKRKDKLKYHVDHVHVARFSEQPVSVDKTVSASFQEPSKGYESEPKASVQSTPSNVCIPVTLVPVSVAGAAQGDVHAHRASALSSQAYSVVSIPAQGQQQNSGYQATTDLAFLEKYTLTPQPTNIVHPVRPEQILDQREQSYLGTLLGLDSASLVQNISSSDHAH